MNIFFLNLSFIGLPNEPIQSNKLVKEISREPFTARVCTFLLSVLNPLLKCKKIKNKLKKCIKLKSLLFDESIYFGTELGFLCMLPEGKTAKMERK